MYVRIPRTLRQITKVQKVLISVLTFSLASWFWLFSSVKLRCKECQPATVHTTCLFLVILGTNSPYFPSQEPRPHLGSSQPLLDSFPGHFLWVNWPEREVDYAPHLMLKSWRVSRKLHSPIRLHGLRQESLTSPLVGVLSCTRDTEHFWEVGIELVHI